MERSGERTGTLGTDMNRRPALKERQMLAVFLHERLAGSQTVWIRARRHTNICRSFRADGTRIQYPGFRFALPWALVLYAFGVFAKNLVVPLNRSAFDYAKHVQPSRAIANIGPSRFAMAGSGLAPWGLELEARGLDFCILSSTLLTFFRKLGKRILVSFVQESAESQTRAR